MGYQRYISENEQAEFNLASGTVIRMDEKLREINYCFHTKNFKLCFETLQIMYSEISPFLKKVELEEMDGIEKEIKGIVDNCTAFNPRGRKWGFNPTIELIDALRDWDRKLRRLMLKYHLYMKMTDTRLPASKVG